MQALHFVDQADGQRGRGGHGEAAGEVDGAAQGVKEDQRQRLLRHT
jgi:hypothetical protein